MKRPNAYERASRWGRWWESMDLAQEYQRAVAAQRHKPHPPIKHNRRKAHRRPR